MKPSQRISTLLIFSWLVLSAAVILLIWKQNPQPPFKDHLRGYVNQIRARLNPSPFECTLGEICLPSQKRPLLADGRLSRALWDVPRNYMKHNFSAIPKKYPGTVVHFAWTEPLVVFYDNVLTDEEIDMMITKASTKYKKSEVVHANGVVEEDETRTSYSAWLYHADDAEVASVVEKVTSLTGFSAMHAESIAVNRYEGGQYFNPHWDYLQEDQLNSLPNFAGCQRTSTILMYLSDVQEGGETVFARDGKMDGNFEVDENNPDHLQVTPKRGRILVWYDMHPFTEWVDHRTLHGGSPVIRGTKFAATIFMRNCTDKFEMYKPQGKTEL